MRRGNRNESETVQLRYLSQCRAFREKQTISAKPLGIHAGFTAWKCYTAVFTELEYGEPDIFPECTFKMVVTTAAQEDNCLHFPLNSPHEEEYFISVFKGPEDEKTCPIECIFLWSALSDCRNMPAF